MESAGMVIVGAGECGARAAFALREEEYAGPVTLIGEERHLPYERPPLSKDGMAETRAGMKLIADAARFEASGIRLMLSAGIVGIEREARCVRLPGGATLPYDKLLLATGARPRRLAMAEGRAHCLYLRTHDDAEAIAGRLGDASRISVVGGGFIGLELAAAARRRGAAVTVIEAQPRLLERAVPAAIAERLADAHRMEGVCILTGAAIASIEDAAAGVAINLADGHSLESELAVIGIGAVPNTELAQAAGLTCDNGIRVDAHLRTDDPRIFAAGDCCAFPLAIYGGRRVRLEAWRNAQEQGALAARNMLDRAETHAAVPWFWSDQYDLTLQMAGLADEAETTVRRTLSDGAFILFHLAADGRLVAASGIGPGNAVARDIRVAEMLIARRAAPPAAELASPSTKLKTLLAA